MNRLLPTSLLLGAALCQRGVLAQPAVPDAKGKTSTFSVAELEQFLGGRTLVTLDLKDATLEQVAAALGQASNQKIEARAPAPPMRYSLDGKPPVALAAPLYNFSTIQTPFWPTLRAWQLAARRAPKAAPAAPALGTMVFEPAEGKAVPNSLGLSKNGAGWFLQADNGLADGRAVEAWPFLLIANDLKRNQDGSLSDDGMNEPVNPSSPPGLAALLNPAATAPRTEAKTPDTESWSDRLTLGGKVLIDPKLNPLNLRYEVLEALDDQGNDRHFGGETRLYPINVPAPRPIVPVKVKLPPGLQLPDITSLLNSIPSPTGFGMSLQIPLRSKPGMGKRLMKLRGVLRFSVVSRSQHWETTELDKPIAGTVFQNGGEFGVQFKGLEKTEDGWSANFSAQSRGTHLEQMWRDRIGLTSRVASQNGTGNVFSGIGGISRIPSFTVIGKGADPFGGALNFEGVPKMSLVDENGRVFEVKDGDSTSKMTHNLPGAAPVVVSPDRSPLPPDLAQNWTYDESRSFDFTPPSDASGAGAAMGRPAKLVLDLPLERREISVPFEFTNLPLPPS